MGLPQTRGIAAFEAMVNLNDAERLLVAIPRSRAHKDGIVGALDPGQSLRS